MSAVQPPAWDPIDPFELPEWLGVHQVTWRCAVALRGTNLVAGSLTDGAEQIECDLLAVDQAFPAPVADDRLRWATHEAWRRGDLFVLARLGRLTLALPGTGVDADAALDALGRFAKALGAPPSSYLVELRCGG
ncbi:MAG: hypothetical protein QM638_03235 [Nocardioides sp.]|uniref:hypothetical protein n=1 Tax=Nocardioides sp. TaxID=35761 RepID=UPI0039E2E4B4